MAIFTFFCFTGKDSLCAEIFFISQISSHVQKPLLCYWHSGVKKFLKQFIKVFFIDIRNFSKKILNVEIFTNVFFKPNEVARKLIQIIN